MIVVDASVVLSWLFPDERTGFALRAARLAVSESMIVPSFFPFEVSNGLHSAVRRSRVTEEEADALLGRLRELPVHFDSHGFELDDEFELARRHGLTIYDAAYLALARRLRIPLYTLDVDLQSAAAREKLAGG